MRLGGKQQKADRFLQALFIKNGSCVDFDFEVSHTCGSIGHSWDYVETILVVTWLIHCYQLVIAYLSRRKFLQNLPLLGCHKIAKCRVGNGMLQLNGLNHIFANKRNCGKRLGAPLYHLKQLSFFQ